MASNQSWTSWILDSYASSVHPSESPETEPEETKAASPPSSPYGPFTKTGRGGAGNFTWQSDLPETDVEAQRQSTLTERQRAAAQTEHLETADALSKTRKEKAAQYLKIGIGGAGNIALVQSNKVQSPRSPSFTRSPSSPLSGTFSGIHHGRGGAGNYAAAAEIDKKVESEKEYAERIAMETMREKAEQDVENILKPPQGALLSEGRRREGLV